MQLRLLVLAFLVMLYSPAFAADRVHVASGSDVEVHVNTSIKREGPYALATAFYQYKTVKKTGPSMGNKMYNLATATSIVNCTNETISMIRHAGFWANENGDSKMMFDVNFPENEREVTEARPGSFAGAIVEFVCKGKISSKK